MGNGKPPGRGNLRFAQAGLLPRPDSFSRRERAGARELFAAAERLHSRRSLCPAGEGAGVFCHTNVRHHELGLHPQAGSVASLATADTSSARSIANREAADIRPLFVAGRVRLGSTILKERSPSDGVPLVLPG